MNSLALFFSLPTKSATEAPDADGTADIYLLEEASRLFDNPYANHQEAGGRR